MTKVKTVITNYSEHNLRHFGELHKTTTQLHFLLGKIVLLIIFCVLYSVGTEIGYWPSLDNYSRELKWV